METLGDFRFYFAAEFEITYALRCRELVYISGRHSPQACVNWIRRPAQAMEMPKAIHKFVMATWSRDGIAYCPLFQRGHGKEEATVT